ncbi:ATP-binding cassette domain-containing protein, partial [Rhizobiaceae sp. 2RAB30]
MTTAATPAGPAIEFDKVSLSFGGKPVISDLSLSVGRGEIVCIIGPSGCGKTTALRMAGGLVRPDSGTVRLLGQPISGPRRDVAIVFQDYGKALLPWRTAAGNVSLALEAAGVPSRDRKERIHGLLGKVGLPNHADKYPTEMSGGMQQRLQIARCLALDADRVTLIHAHGAGCYGHNGADDAALDAAIIAMEFPGRPVRIQWSREDELARGPVGAAMGASIDAAIDAEGNIASWTVAVSSAPHAQRPGFGGHVNLTSAEALDPSRLPVKVDDLPEAAGGGASRNSVAIYDLPNHAVRVVLDTDSRIRTSSLRSLGAHLNVFAIESAMDELADMAGLDPLDFRLRHLSDERCCAVLAGAAEMSGWPVGQPAGEGRALGLAAARYENKGAWLAAVAEVTVDEGIHVERLWLCVDAGLIVNPEGARNQIEGGAIQAVCWTVKEEVPIGEDRIP